MRGKTEADIEGDICKSVGLKVRDLRKDKRMSLVELAGATGISQGHLSKIETGKTTISIKALSQICRYFERPLHYLFHREEEKSLLLGTLNIGDGPEKEAIVWLGDEIRRSTQDQFSLIRLEANQLGTATNPVEHLQKGHIHLFMDDFYLFREYVPAFDLFSLPYLFPRMGGMISFLDSPLFQEEFVLPLLEHGIRLINPQWNWHRGVEMTLISHTPVFSPEEVKGKRVRICDSQVSRLYWKSLGAEPVFIPWEHTAQAMNAGEIDLLPCFKSHIYHMKFCQRAKYITEMGGLPSMVCMAVNEKKYQLLPPRFQRALVTACGEAGQLFSHSVVENNHACVARNIKENHAVYIKTELGPWQQAAEALRPVLVAEKRVSQKVMAAISAI